MPKVSSNNSESTTPTHPFPTASASVAEMMKQCEIAEIDLSKVSFMLKFKKDHAGSPMTLMMSNKTNNVMDALADKIIEESKVVRAVAPYALK